MADTEVVLGGLRFPESPRWRDGALWFAEKRAGRVVRLDPSGDSSTAADVPGGPGGIGWLPDGRMLVVSMNDRTILAFDGGASTVHSDVSAITVFRCNDMVVAADGRAWVGDFGYDLPSGAPPAPGNLVSVAADGSAEHVADDLGFPNGIVLTGGGDLVVAESSANRLTAFTVADDGRLGDRRVWADLGATVPDGICLDAEGAIWVADPLAGEVVRVHDGGEVSARVRTVNSGAFACVLGGDDGRTLYICTATEEASMDPSAPPVGAIEVVTVDVPSGESP